MSTIDDIEQRLAALGNQPTVGHYAVARAEFKKHAPTDIAALVAFARAVEGCVNDGHNAHDPAYDTIRDLLLDLEQS